MASSQLKDTLISFLTEEEIIALIKKIARRIEADYEGESVVLVCPLKGSIHFVADLSRELALTQEIDFIEASALKKGETIHIRKDIGLNVLDKHIIIVEEIIDTGRTLSFLKKHLLASSPASVKIATLLDKPARREIPLRPDYIGKTIEDRYVIGYGMDSDQLGRNYRNIYVFPS